MKKLTIVMSLALFWNVIAMNAQSSFGTIAGLVRNPAKVPVAGATVTATKLDGSTIRTTISGSDGLYSFSDVLPGSYSVIAQADGYPDTTLSSLQVTAGRATRADIAMPAAINPPVTISSVSPVSSPQTPAAPVVTSPSAVAPAPAPALVSAAAPAVPAPAQTAAATPSNTTASTPAPAAAPAPKTYLTSNGSHVVNVSSMDSRGLTQRMNWREILVGSPKSKDDTSDPVLTASTAPPPAGAFDPPAAAGTGDPQQAPPNSTKMGAPPAGIQGPAEPAPAAPAPVDNQTPFAYADFTWMNAVPRNHDSVLDGKYFSGEFRVDTNYIYDYNHPIDHTLGGTTEGTRTGEVVLQALNVGGDFHWDHMQGRILMQIGADATAVPRNDASPSVGQWDISNAYRYISEGYAGYHLDVQHGLNFQAGIFMSYIGLFSYYSFDNWSYQPSYVSSNTPWFFNGFRVQWFPSNKLKFEPWLINGWQSYGKYNGKPGVGGQILWRPTGNLDFVWNTYALGQDTVATHRTRLHEDDSMEWKYWENPNKLMHRMAMSFTFDIGCETGGGTPVVAGETPGVKVDCAHPSRTAPVQNFIGAMAYNRWTFDHDKFGATIGGGFMVNPGGYLVLLPPINGATATSGIPFNYFPVGPGVNFKGYDYQATFDWMPTQFVTWRLEFTQRGTNIPYFTGPGGITPPGGNNGSPSYDVCMDGTSSPSGVCTADGGLWSPDLRKQERRWTIALMVHL